MRLIGTVKNKTYAERVAAYMMTQEVSTHCEEEQGEWQVWVRDEDQIPQAKELLSEFRENPEDIKYQQAVAEAQKIAREQEKKRQEAKANQVILSQDRWNAPITKVAPFTIALVVISVIVSVFLTNFGDSTDSAAFRALSFSSISKSDVEKFAPRLIEEDGTATIVTDIPADSNYLRFAGIRKGEFWRLVTPIFIHFDILHLLFNMYWLVFFGKQIEARYGPVWLGILVLVTAILSNAAQCGVPAAWDGSVINDYGHHWTIAVGGMSGVLYGLFGYVWMKMIFDPKSQLHISMISAAILMVWFVACLSPNFFLNVANWAHGIGFVVGLIIGYTPKVLSDLGIGSKK